MTPAFVYCTQASRVVFEAGCMAGLAGELRTLRAAAASASTQVP